ncbi:MAG TPA: phage major capsid protein [Solirubrobacteraceae bacterium]
MCPQRNAWDDDPEGEAPPGERPFGTRPFGTRPFGTRPFGTRPFGTRPFGTRPFGTRPFGTRPFGTRPFGTRPFGTRPFGTRPFGTRPFGTRPFGTRPFGTREDEQGDDGLDPGAWSADVAELFCAMSATVRLGARIVCDVDNLLIPNRRVRAVYVAPPNMLSTGADLRQAEEADDEPVGASRRADALGKARVSAAQRLLRPSEHELAVQIVVRNSLLGSVERHPEVADALKQDIARALVYAADGAFLHGTGADSTPEGITEFCDELKSPTTNPLELARAILRQLRVETPKRFENPGWVFDPATLDELTRQLTAEHASSTKKSMKTLDATRMLQLDGIDGGTLLGYPFLVSRAATENGASRIYFSSDWTEAWIAAASDLVCVDFSTDADFAADSTIVRAVMNHDFVVRRPGLFTFTAQRKST